MSAPSPPPPPPEGRDGDAAAPAPHVAMTPEERAVFERRRRGRNIALFVALLALVGLFYLISVARLSRGAML